jgi:hypothetical protein
MPHTLPLRFHVPTKIVHVFVVEYSESLWRLRVRQAVVYDLKELVTLHLERHERSHELDRRW